MAMKVRSFDAFKLNYFTCEETRQIFRFLPESAVLQGAENWHPEDKFRDKLNSVPRTPANRH